MGVGGRGTWASVLLWNAEAVGEEPALSPAPHGFPPFLLPSLASAGTQLNLFPGPYLIRKMQANKSRSYQRGKFL